ncbi:hypothetical protein IE077_000559 [Cardiosporidium cionae]|uniref:Thioesterase domain-containing protein n=1 Tax=Cardiosporidium cionae TaxID=476202 RepID=A0ABQ7JF85_9APIC|nr:hypothetical protein IE077_000559 [Cardiosporidium cionae]|eukprot:KAF8822539.1 hypothetical protein IE077_000559 [Cardiosporidium cionae]
MAGMEQLAFTGRGTPKNPQPNLLLEYCLKEQIEMLAVQLPGRAGRISERPYKNAREIASSALSVLTPKLTEKSCEYAICAHSMGALCAFEFVQLAAQTNIPLPVHIFISCMLSPDTPVELRPWKPAKFCSSDELKEEVRSWGANDIVFRPDVWESYEELFRSDFAVFDEYLYDESSTPLSIPSTLFYATRDSRITTKLMRGWKKLLSNDKLGDEVEFVGINGTHSFFYQTAAREQWMKCIIAKVDLILLDLVYG